MCVQTGVIICVSFSMFSIIHTLSGVNVIHIFCCCCCYCCFSLMHNENLVIYSLDTHTRIHNRRHKRIFWAVLLLLIAVRIECLSIKCSLFFLSVISFCWQFIKKNTIHTACIQSVWTILSCRKSENDSTSICLLRWYLQHSTKHMSLTRQWSRLKQSRATVSWVCLDISSGEHPSKRESGATPTYKRRYHVISIN